jgi:putative Ig domain-containing protein
MDRRNFALLSGALFVAIVLGGCGSSGNGSSDGGGPLQITTQSPLPGGHVNSAYSVTFTATGGTPPYAWSASNLPLGLVMSPAGTLSGTPTQPWGTPITVAVSDSRRGNANGTFQLTIADVLQITTTSLPNGSVGVAYEATLMATGGFPPYTWSINGNLPGGLTLNASTGVISGTATNTGTSNFAAQVTETGSPALATSVNLSITINAPPPRTAALYVSDQAGYAIASDGSLMPLPSSPEMVIGNVLESSPTLPLVFTVTTKLQALLVQPDYSLTLISAGVALPNAPSAPGKLSVDPSGANIYVPGYIDNGQTTGLLYYRADGSFDSPASIAIPNLSSFVLVPSIVFTPDSTMGFVRTCPQSGPGSILSYSRAPDGSLSLQSTYTFAAGCANTFAVSPDGRYLAVSIGPIQVLGIGSDGTLRPATPPLNIYRDPQNDPVIVNDLTWDSSGSYLLLATSSINDFGTGPGGVAVVAFSGTALTESAFPVGDAVENIRRSGSFVYAHVTCDVYCALIDGFNFENGQLTPLVGSPFRGGNIGSGDFVIY